MLQVQNIVIAGGTGLVGRHLAIQLDPNFFQIYILTRKKRPSQDNIHYVVWDPASGFIDETLPDVDIVINLAGEGIAEGRWTTSRKKALLDSRIQSVETLKKWISSRQQKPSLFIGASAVGYYGHRGDEELTEDAKPGREFMSQLCLDWEKSSLEIKPLVQRTVLLRIGIVLSMEGGALPKMLMTKPFGFLSYFGHGKQYYPWIHISDLTGIIMESIRNQHYEGIINAVSPQEITNKKAMYDIAKKTGGIFLVLPVPAFLLKLILGEMSKVVLNSNRVIPQKLRELGFSFKYIEFDDAVKSLL